MPRWFNVSGPCNPADHYMLPVLRRVPSVRALIDQKSYFVLHAPRQVGKTTTMLGLAKELTREGRYCSAVVSMETGAPFSSDPGAAEVAVLASWRWTLERQLPEALRPPPWPEAGPGARLGAALAAWSKACPRPLALFLDEIDALRDEALLSVLRQLRAGYFDRPALFPSSVALIGMRDVRDYAITSGSSGRLGSSSPFNIKDEALTLGGFTRQEVADLYAQHTTDNGQVFLPEAIDRAFHLTQGQPWLVNALARRLTQELVPDRAQAITAADVDRAKEILIRRQDTHLDSLSERLREPRVRQILEPMLAGTFPGDLPRDDVRYLCDLGLLVQENGHGLTVANPIYREIIVRDLAAAPTAFLPTIAPSWLRPDGRLDADKLLAAFVAFWRQHGEAMLKSAPYHEIAPHLVLMAFLHRVVNGGGTIDREYAIGSGRMDLCVRYGPDLLALELKVWREGEPDPLDEGLQQLDGYLAGLGLATGWLVIFDRRPGLARFSQRTSTAPATTPSGRAVVVIRG